MKIEEEEEAEEEWSKKPWLNRNRREGGCLELGELENGREREVENGARFFVLIYCGAFNSNHGTPHQVCRPTKV